MKRIYGAFLSMIMLLGAQGCSVVTIMNAPDVKALKTADNDSQQMADYFGEPVEVVTYANPVILRRDLHEYQAGIEHKVWYSLLSGSAAVYTFGISELSTLPIATEAAHATESLRVYYGHDNRVYGSASYSKKIGMWLPNFIGDDESFREGFPCNDFTMASRNVMTDRLKRAGRPDLASRIANCLSLERIQMAGH